MRHGQTPSNVTGALDTTVPGAPLSALGHEQAAVVADELGSRRIGAVFASSMLRAQQTAGPTAARLGLEIQVEDGLREISAGLLEMRSDHASVARYRDFLIGCAAGEDLLFPGGETSAGVIARFDRAVGHLLGLGLAEVVIVSHGAVIRAWTGLRAANLDADFVLANPLRNTGTVELEVAADGHCTAVSWDTTPVDAAGLPTGPPGPAGEAAP